MNLKDKKCIASYEEPTRLTSEIKENYLKELSPYWKMDQNGSELRLELSFKSFKKPYSLVQKIAEIAELEKHHPDIHFGWGYLKLLITSHNYRNLYENDFILAAKIDDVLKDFT